MMPTLGRIAALAIGYLAAVLGVLLLASGMIWLIVGAL